MADKDYCPKFNAKKFGKVRQLLLDGNVEEAASTCASIIVSSGKKALATHDEVVQAYLSHLQKLASCPTDERQEMTFPTTALVTDKDAETLRRAACDAHTQLQYSDDEQATLGDIPRDFLVRYFQHQELRQCLAPMEAEAAEGHFPTDQTLLSLFQEMQERTAELYREAVKPLLDGKGLDQVTVKRPRGKAKVDTPLSQVLGSYSETGGN